MATPPKRVRFVDTIAPPPRAADAGMVDAADAPSLPSPAVAAALRAAARDADSEAAYVDGVEGLAAAEEAPPSEADAAFHGYPLEPFSMRAERAAAAAAAAHSGRPIERDAWVAGLGGADDDGSSDDDDDESDGDASPPPPPLPLGERNALRLRLARLLRPNESPVDALRRLSAPTPLGSRLPRLTVPAESRAEFDEISDLADRLMAAGDVGCHTASKERLVAATGARADAGARAPVSDDGTRSDAALLATLEAAAAASTVPAGGVAVPPELEGTDYRAAVPPDAGAAPGAGAQPLLYSSSRGLWVDPAHPGVVRCAATGRWKRARAVTDDGGASGTPVQGDR